MVEQTTIVTNTDGTQTAYIRGRERVSMWKKINPIWWFKNGDSWTAPMENNGEPYLPGVTNQLLRNFYWWCRNPMANFVGYIMGVEDHDYDVVGEPPVMETTWRDVEPRGSRVGWKRAHILARPSLGYLFVTIFTASLIILGAAALLTPVELSATGVWMVALSVLAFPVCFARTLGYLPFVSYYGDWRGKGVEFYLGWRPYSGGFGWKLTFHKGFGHEDVTG